MIDLEPVIPFDPEETRRAQKSFLEEFARTHSRMKAMQKAGIGSLRIVEGWVRDDPVFREAFGEAQALLADQMEAAAFERGVVGVDRPVFQGGECVGYVREFSDTMLSMLLKAKIPEQYGSHRNTLDLPMGGDHGPLPSPMTIEIVHEIGREFGQMLARRAGELPVEASAKVGNDGDDKAR